MKRRRFAIGGVAAVIAVAAAALGLARLVGGGDLDPARDALGSQKAAIEAAVFRYETTIRQRTWNPHRSAQLRAVDCEQPAPLFRGRPAFRCAIRDQDAGIEARCYALVGRALYEVGGCFDPARDLGAGKSLLLTRSSQ
jgi:hypothetical protein